MPHIFIDESGDIGLLNSRVRFYVVGHILTDEPKPLQRHINNYLIKMQNRDEYPLKLQELKFYLPKRKLKEKLGYTDNEINSFLSNMNKIRNDVLKIINDYSDGIFVTVLDKQSRNKKTWDEERIGNFIIGHTLINNVVNLLNCNEPPSIIYDTGRLSIKKKIDYHDYLNYKCQQYCLDGKFGKFPTFNDVDSVSEPCIWGADFVAGSYYHYCVNNDDCYTRILQKKIGIGIRKYWDE